METTFISNSITTTAAMQLAEAAMEHGQAIGVEISLSIVSPQMEEIVFVRRNAATAHSQYTAKKKALTAASTKRATGWMNDSLEITLPMATGVLTNILGGMPIWVDGDMVGAIGIAGGTVDQDAQIAQKALEQMNFLKEEA